MFTTRHFVTGNFVSHASFVDDATYSTILDNVVKATCDVFLTRPAQCGSDVEILMGERVGLPHADWWIPGGRMMPGESCASAARRILKRELNLDIGSDDPTSAWQQRVATIATYTFVWDTRTQEPIHNGTCDVSSILCIDLTESEALQCVLKSHEYKQLEWRTLSSQSEVANSSSCVLHPALAQGIRDLVAMRKWREIVTGLRQLRQEEDCSAEKRNELIKKLEEFAVVKGELLLSPAAEAT